MRQFLCLHSNPTSSPSHLQGGTTQFIQGLFSHLLLYMVLYHIYIYVYFFVCLHRNPTRSPSHLQLQGGRWDLSFHLRTVFELTRLFAPEIFAVFSRMGASLIQVFLFRQRMGMGGGRRIFLNFFLCTITCAIRLNFKFQIDYHACDCSLVDISPHGFF